MRHCSFCTEEVYTVDRCVDRKLVFGDDTDGEIRRSPDDDDLVDPVAYGDEAETEEDAETCSMCRVNVGEFHHPGCTYEECPNCGERLVSCDCHPHTLTRKTPEA